MKPAYVLLAGMLAVGPTLALAQTTGPEISGTRHEDRQVVNGAATDPNQKGATGTTTIPGNNSTVAGDSQGTAMKSTGGGGGGGSK